MPSKFRRQTQKQTSPVFWERQFWVCLMRFFDGLNYSSLRDIVNKFGVAASPVAVPILIARFLNQRYGVALVDNPTGDNTTKRAAVTFYALLHAGA